MESEISLPGENLRRPALSIESRPDRLRPGAVHADEEGGAVRDRAAFYRAAGGSAGYVANADRGIGLGVTGT